MKTTTNIIAGILASMGFATRFNMDNSPIVLQNLPSAAPTRKRGAHVGIKGMKSSNFTSYGVTLQSHFDSRRMADRRTTAKNITARTSRG